ncbi:hypothetical protein [Pusillimonas sp. ANT_WB101]|uniref:hypothetical protein n=1 Tax=Pusillimonas sp. ANT_WB101 TaxID=2597356 RepID=UPI0011ED8B50|nr:hypothetical protein [Pusillimonas sp. ANT_WB101]KAA0910916.1 hypothetical protein FQ179_03375 [Pusillimonas sp. ANT_WB101]
MLHALLAALPDISLQELAIRMLATTFIVMAVTWAVGVFGPLIGGALAGLPITLGPGFFFLSKQATAPFVSQAASYALLSLCATQFFLLAYMMTAKRCRPIVCLGIACMAWLFFALLFRFLPPLPWINLGLFVLTTATCWRYGARFLSDTVSAKGKTGFGLLLLRGIIAGVLVATVTTASHWIGPMGSGLILAFPVGFTVMTITIHQRFGPSCIIATIHSIMLGTGSLAAFCATIALLIPHMSAHLTLSIAVSCAVCVTLTLAFRGKILAAFRR